MNNLNNNLWDDLVFVLKRYDNTSLADVLQATSIVERGRVHPIGVANISSKGISDGPQGNANSPLFK